MDCDQQWDITSVSDIPARSDLDSISAQVTTVRGRKGGTSGYVVLTAGTRLNHFVVERKLAEGGMGAVWLARDTQLDRPVALKVLLPRAVAMQGPEQARARLLREAQAVARINHRNIVTVFEVGTVGQCVYVAMEYLPRGTVRQWLSDKPRSRKEIYEVFDQVAAGLQAAHDAGLVHRDVKPENILLDETGRAVLSDFGLVTGLEVANVQATPPAADGPHTEQPFAATTRTGAVKGTPAYMAPEQFAGLATDHRADQFAFAVSLHEALYGARPFPEESYTKLASSVESGKLREFPVTRRAPERPTLVRALSAKPADRFNSMNALMSALRRSTQRRSTVRRRVVGLVGVAILAVLASVWWQSRSPVASQASEARAPVITPASISLSITTTPSGATLRSVATGQPIGTTPAVVSVDQKAGGSVEYVVNHPGFREQKITMSTERPSVQHIVLAPIAAATQAKTVPDKSQHAPSKRRRRVAKRKTETVKPKPATDKRRSVAAPTRAQQPPTQPRRPRRLGPDDLAEPRFGS